MSPRSPSLHGHASLTPLPAETRPVFTPLIYYKHNASFIPSLKLNSNASHALRSHFATGSPASSHVSFHHIQMLYHRHASYHASPSVCRSRSISRTCASLCLLSMLPSLLRIVFFLPQEGATRCREPDLRRQVVDRGKPTRDAQAKHRGCPGVCW